MPKRSTARHKLTPKLVHAFEQALGSHNRGDFTAAEAGYQTVLRKIPTHVESALNLSLLYSNAGDPPRAIVFMRAFIARVPNEPRTNFNLAELLFSANEYEQAEGHYIKGIKAPLLKIQARVKAAVCAGYLGREAQAQAAFERMAEDYADHGEALADIGTGARAIGLVEPAITYFERARKLLPEDELLLNNLAVCYVDRGQIELAEEALQRSLQLNPYSSSAWFNRVRLQRYEAGDVAVLKQMKVALRQAGEHVQGCSMLNFALAKVYQDLGDFDAAFAHYSTANRLQAQMARYDRHSQEAGLDEIISSFSAAELQRTPVIKTDLPVLIVGMPRSGTTLIEQIVSSHPAVHGAGELRDLAACARALDQHQRYPLAIGQYSQELLHDAAHGYLGKLERLSGDGVACVTDKLPTNFLNLGLAARLFSGVRIVHCRRNPMDTCLSNFIQYFPEGHAYANSLADIGHFYSIYRRLMSHWDSVLQQPILHVDYESVVEDVESEARRLIDFLGLPWDQRCVDFHHNQRTVGTASNWQVRQPIYREARQRWRHYESHLEPLMTALGGYAQPL